MAYNQDYNTKITTNGMTLFDENGVMLRLDFLDDALSVQIGFPDIVDGKRKYPTEKRQSLIVTNDRVSALYDIVINKVLPAIEAGKDYDGGIFTSKRKDGVFEVAVQSGEPYLMYHKDIDADRKPKATYIFKFDKTSIIEKYNVESTEFEQCEVHAKFTLFVKLLEGFVLLSNNITTHSYRHANKYTTDKIFLYLNEIAKKMGLTVESRSSYGTPNVGFSDDLPFGNEEPAMPPVNNVSTLDGLLS